MDGLPICTHCGFTWGEYRLRGLLGCPHCYASFGEALQGDLLWIHEALGANPVPEAAPGQDAPERMARLREQLADAVRNEDYAAAAALQKRIRDGEPAPGTGASPSGTGDPPGTGPSAGGPAGGKSP